MKAVFVGGSRSISRLNAPIRSRIDNIMSKGLHVIVGDANGADKAFQAYLAERGYENVTVFCSGGACRNNVGNWNTTHVASDSRKLDFIHYARKDARMASEADYGFFVWNGDSRGTANSVSMLVKRQCPAIVYVEPARKFVTVRNEADLPTIFASARTLGTASRRTSARQKLSSGQLPLASHRGRLPGRNAA